MQKEKMNETKLNRMILALSIAEEFGQKVELLPEGRIIVMIHDRVRRELENRLRQIHWRYIHVSRKVGPFRILALVDSFR
jgi:hypothetical protein